MANYKLVHSEPAPRVELHEALGLTGAEVSINTVPPNGGVPFVHVHTNNEELYIVLEGKGELWIDGETLPATYRIYYRLPQGIYVTRVYRNSDAAAKGISEGDIITAINGVSVTTMEQLNRVKNQFTAGQTITLTIYHGGVSSDVEIILMDRANA